MFTKRLLAIESKLQDLEKNFSECLSEFFQTLHTMENELLSIRKENQEIKTLLADLDASAAERQKQIILDEGKQLQASLTDFQKVAFKRLDVLKKSGRTISNSVENLEKNMGKNLKLSERLLDEMSRYTILSRRSPKRLIRGSVALKQLLENYEFQTVLDIGCGEGLHSEAFLQAGKTVTAIDYGKSAYFSKKNAVLKAIVADFNTYEFGEQFDCVWCSHVLEYQLNVNQFLKKCFSILKDGGVLSISVPPAKAEIVSGHVSLWNPGLLLYNLILAGFDCSEAVVEVYDYDISVIVRKKSVPTAIWSQITFDVGDLKMMRDYFPAEIKWDEGQKDVTFDGELIGLLPRQCLETETTAKPVPLRRWIEITTKIGCSNQCAYCPQEVFVKAYTKGNLAPVWQLSLENFKKALAHIPVWLDICFTGLSEPFENPKAFQMLEYAVKKGYKVHVYSTLKALSIVEIDRFRDLNIQSYVIHLPDEEGMMSLRVDDEYLEKLNFFNSLELPNVSYVCIGEPHHLIPEKIEKCIKKEKLVLLRAGNLDKEKISKYRSIINYHPSCGRVLDEGQRLICNHRIRYKGSDRRATHAEATIMLPDGRMILCCQDFGMQHVLGNLFEEDYESIMYGDIMKSIEDSMMCKNRVEILCRSCELAKEYDESKWSHFLETGKYE